MTQPKKSSIFAPRKPIWVANHIPSHGVIAVKQNSRTQCWISPQAGSRDGFGNTSPAINKMKEIANATLKQLGESPKCPTGANGANGMKMPGEGKEANHEEGKRLERWYDNFEVMKMFHISQRTLQTLRSNGKLPFTKLGNKCFYRGQDLQQMMMESFRDSRVKGGGAWQ